MNNIISLEVYIHMGLYMYYHKKPYGFYELVTGKKPRVKSPGLPPGCQTV